MELAVRQGDPTRLGSYEIIRHLARGGMADLFLAKTVTNTFERVVVLKKILDKFASNPRYVQLFVDEAKLASSLNHKNIVQVFDAGGVGRDRFFAMEFVHGQDVRTILHRAFKRGEKMPIKLAIQIATQVAQALHFAHEKRRPDGSLLDIVHRDVSPSNIIVSYEGAVKLLDFGVAKAATSTIKTRTGTLKGKIAYMSPEQAKGASIDRRSDVFSLGIVLWEMVTTTRLFRGENDLATLQLIINHPPRKPSELNPECPPELERIILRALAQDPKARYQTAHELAVELEDLVRQLQFVQSSTELSLYMSVLFEGEIRSWHKAKEAGVELSEHLTSVGTNTEGLTTPVSESEFIEAVEEIDEDEDLLEDEEPETLRPVAGTIEARSSKPSLRDKTPPPVFTPQPATPTPARLPRLDGTPLPSVVVGKVDPTLTRTPITTPSAGVPTWPSAAQPVALGEPHFTPEQAQKLRRQATYIGAGLLALILVVAIVKSTGGGDAPEAEPAAPAAATSPATDTTGEPAPTPTLPSTPPPPPASPPEPAPAAVAEPASEPEPTPAAVAEPDPAPAPAAAVATDAAPTPPPATAPPPATPPVRSTTRASATKPSTRTTTKPTTTRATSTKPTRPSTRPTTKPTTKRRPFDPNAPLPRR